MKLKKTIFTLISLALLLCLCLCACKSKENEEQTDNTEPLGAALSEYTVIRSTDAKPKLSELCVEFAAELSTLAGTDIKVGNDSSEAGDEALEILIGETNRSESGEAKQMLSSDGYIITQIDKKIVINASNGVILEDAMNYFLTAIQRLEDNTFSIPEKYICEGYKSLSVLNSGKSSYALVYAENDAKFNKELADGIAAKLSEISNGTITVLPESKAVDAVSRIFIGDIEGKSDSRFDYCHYGVAINGNDIYLCGQNRTLLSLSCEQFATRMARYSELVKTSTSDITVYYTDLFTVTDETRKSDAPLPSELTPAASETRVGGSVLVYKDAPESAFSSYRDTLSAAGFEMYTETQNDGGKYAGYKKEESSVYFYYLTATKELYVILEKYTEPPAWTSSEKTVSTPTMTQIGYEYTSVKDFISNGMCYVTVLEDGSFVIVDGGRRDDEKKNLADELYNYLKANNKRTDGKIVISAWIITHGHVDHYQTLEFFGEKYGDKVNLEYLMYCYPDEIELRHEENSGDGYFTEHFEEILASYHGAKAYIPHTGESFNIKNLFIEILGTYELLYPSRLDEGNDCCMTFRFVFNKGQSNAKSVIFLADIYKDMSERLEKIYGYYLKSDVVQVAHHGWNNGGSMMLYRKIKADHALWSNCYKHLYADTQESSQGYGVYIRKILEGINANIKFYPTTSISGNPRNTVLTFGSTLIIS